MRLGLSSLRLSRRAAGGGFDPVALFDDASGFLLDRPNPANGNQWLTTAQAEFADAPDDPVGHYDSRDPENNYAVQAAASSRPILGVSDGFWHHSFDGSADFWFTQTTPLAAGTTIAIACNPGATVNDHILSSSVNTSHTCLIFIGTGGVIGASLGNLSDQALSTVEAGSPMVIVMRGIAQDHFQLFINGALAAENNSPAGAVTAMIPLAIMALNNNGSAAGATSGTVWGAFGIQKYLNDAEVEALTKYLAKLIPPSIRPTLPF